MSSSDDESSVLLPESTSREIGETKNLSKKSKDELDKEA
jgi:hypothetical protein